MSDNPQLEMPVYGPAISPAMFETKWLKKFNTLLSKLKLGPQAETRSRFNLRIARQAVALVVPFAKEARDLQLKEEDFYTGPLFFERLGQVGLLPEKHLNPFEAAEHYRCMVHTFVEEKLERRLEREYLGMPLLEVSGEDIADVVAIGDGIEAAKGEVLCGVRREQVVFAEGMVG